MWQTDYSKKKEYLKRTLKFDKDAISRENFETFAFLYRGDPEHGIFAITYS
jgi:hypothetical protein